MTERTSAGGAARAAISALGGVGLLAGVVGAAGTALMRQGRTTAATVELMALQAARAQGLIGQDEVRPLNQLPVPNADGVYAPLDDQIVGPVDRCDWTGEAPLVLLMLGDSTSVGYGVLDQHGLPGVQLARGLIETLERPVRLVTRGVIGSGAADLDRQVTESLVEEPSVVVIISGANDITDQVPPWESVRMLKAVVQRLREREIPVVVGSCPSFGVIPTIPPPLRQILGLWSSRLGVMQERATAAAGGIAVPIGRTVSPLFRADPGLFSADGFHPGDLGYAKAVEALLPAVLESLTT